MFNLKKLIENIIDIIAIIYINAFVVTVFYKILSIFITNENIIFYIIIIIDAVPLILQVPTILKSEKTLGKWLSKRIIKNEEKKISIITIIIISIIIDLILSIF